MESLRSRLTPHTSVSGGYTLVELLVVLAIMIVIMGIVLSGQSGFNRSLILANTAYDVALTIRGAETYGIASRGSAASTNTGYGVHFSSGTPTSFIFFADTSPAASCGTPDCKPGDHVYTPASDYLVQTYTLGNGINLTNACATAGGTTQCASTGALTSLDISFGRPNPTAYMAANGTYSAVSPVTSACLALSAPNGGSRYITISSAGAIVPNAASCP